MNPEFSQLGKKSEYRAHYAPELLFPIPRKIKRDEIGIDEANLPFHGVDIWNHYEVSWLNPKGKPEVAIATIVVPVTSPNIIESKSMKLYFNSFNNDKFASSKEVEDIMSRDLTLATGAEVSVSLHNLQSGLFNIHAPDGILIDTLDIEINEYNVNPAILKYSNGQLITEKLYSNLLKSNCLVTNQPDWATVIIEYTGKAIDHTSLLKYIISFRNHNEFHEQCVERIFSDIMKHCIVNELTVSARFTRRGGVDINPLRTTKIDFATDNLRLIRQ